jgi:hypothetical protein
MQRSPAGAALRHFGPYVAVWLLLVLMVALTPLTNLWHKWDFWLLQVPLQLGNGLALDRELSVVDLDVDSASKVAEIRARQIALLDAMNAEAGAAPAARAAGVAAGSCAPSVLHVGPLSGALAGPRPKPEAVVFDVAFLKANSALVSQCVRPLVEELHAARMAGIKIYGAMDIESPNAGGSISGNLQLDPGYELNHDERVYAEFNGTGHTEFFADSDRPATPLVYYPKVVIMPVAESGSGEVAPCALPIVTVGQAADECLPLLGMNQQDEVANVIVPLGASAVFERARLSYAQAIRNPSVLGDKIVLIGDERIDSSAGDARSKFEMLAWAMSQSVAGVRSRPYPRVLVDVNTMLGLAIGGSILALASFVYFLNHRRGKPLRLVVATLFALAVPAAAIFAVEANLIAHNELYSQLTLPALTILITIGVAVWAASAAIKRDLFVTALQGRNTGIAERYDVFISYAREPENAAWVKERILGPLSRATMPDGKSLRIFFDTDSIKVGFGWYTTIVDSIYGSRFFVPVYSEGYFDRPFCRDEMEIAMLRQVEIGDFILPVARVATGVPARYARMQFIDVAREPAFMGEIIRIITSSASEASIEKRHYDAADRDNDRESDAPGPDPNIPTVR